MRARLNSELWGNETGWIQCLGRFLAEYGVRKLNLGSVGAVLGKVSDAEDGGFGI